MVSELLSIADENPEFKWVDGLSKALKDVDGFKNVPEKSLKKALKNVDLDDIDDETDAIRNLADDNTFGKIIKAIEPYAPLMSGVAIAGVTAAAMSYGRWSR